MGVLTELPQKWVENSEEVGVWGDTSHTPLLKVRRC
jgi:hypothetical protein